LAHCASVWTTKQSAVASTTKTAIGAKIRLDITITAGLRLRYSISVLETRLQGIPKYDQLSIYGALGIEPRKKGGPPNCYKFIQGEADNAKPSHVESRPSGVTRNRGTNVEVRE
jgi:hypothetical protein